MGIGKEFLSHLTWDADVDMDIIPGQPILEIASNRRVLIENHLGVKAYSREAIHVNVKYGCICIKGCGLELKKMTKDQLVVCGTVHTVALQQGKKP